MLSASASAPQALNKRCPGTCVPSFCPIRSRRRTQAIAKPSLASTPSSFVEEDTQTQGPQIHTDGQEQKCICIVRGVKVIRTLNSEPWDRQHEIELLGVQAKEHMLHRAQASPPGAPPTWRIWPLHWRNGEVAGYVSLHLPLLQDGLVVKGVPGARGNRGNKHVVDMYLFASNPGAHSATARCAEQHWLQPCLVKDNAGRRLEGRANSGNSNRSSNNTSSRSRRGEIGESGKATLNSCKDSSSSNSRLADTSKVVDGGVLWPPAPPSTSADSSTAPSTSADSRSGDDLEAQEVDSWVLREARAASECASDAVYGNPELARWVQLPLPQDCTYGVELELLVWREISQQELQELLENQANVEGWRVVRDGSISAPSRGCTAVEVISPILQGTQGLAQIHRVTYVLATLPATANTSCAIHVHVGARGGWQLNHLRALLQLFSIHEPTLDKLVPPHRRGNNNLHCVSVAAPPSGGGGLSTGVHQATDVESLIAAANPHGRCYKLNLRALSEYGTVEFRHPGSSRNPNTLCGFVVLYLMLVQQAGRVSNKPDAASEVAAAASAAGATAASATAKDCVSSEPSAAAEVAAAASAAGANSDTDPASSFSNRHTDCSDKSRSSDHGAEQPSIKVRHTLAQAMTHNSQAQRLSTDPGAVQPSTADSFAGLAELLGPDSLIEWMVWQEHSISH